MNRINIVLTGFMGCGKTTVGKILAKKLNYQFVDTDHLIEERCGMTVQEIFAAKGEKSFRKMESDMAGQLGKQEGLIISTGGGLMLNPQNITALQQNGRIFCLVATPEEIFKRISGDKIGKRPLLESDNPLERIIDLTRERHKVYRQFIQIDTSGKNIQQITEHLVRIFQSSGDI